MAYNMEELRQWADGRLLEVLGADAYVEAMALMRELEDLVKDLTPHDAAEALSRFQTLVALRYAARQHGET